MDPMTTYEAAVEEAEARQDEQIDEQRIAEAEGWLRGWYEQTKTYMKNKPVAWSVIDVLYDITSESYRAECPDPSLSAAYDVLGLSGTLRALARFVEEEERSRG